MKKIAVIGGGISGLSLSYYLKKLKPEVDITIYEKEKELGGKAKTSKIEGYRIEEGVNGFLTNKPDTLELVESAGLEDILLKSSDLARKRFIYHKGELHRMPEGPSAFIKTSLLSPLGKLSVALEFFRPAKKDDSLETLYDFGKRRLGREFTEVFLDAMSAGVFGSTPKKLCVNAAFPLVVNLEREYGGLFKGMIKKRKKQAGPGGVLTSFQNGMGEFIKKLAGSFDADILCSTPVKKIEKLEDGYRVVSQEGACRFDKVVICTEGFIASRLIEEFASDLSKSLKEIEYSPMAVVALGYDEFPHKLEGFGLLSTTSSKCPILGVLWDSSVFENRSEKGKKLLRVMIGGQRDSQLVQRSDEELISLAKEGILQTMGVRADESVRFVKKWSCAIPNYGLSHIPLRDRIAKETKAYEGLYLNSNTYYGVAFNDCISNSKVCAERIALDLN
ncbi:MAG: protoporphyrinogen oxidase [Campylobacterales bacterium]